MAADAVRVGVLTSPEERVIAAPETATEVTAGTDLNGSAAGAAVPSPLLSSGTATETASPTRTVAADSLFCGHCGATRGADAAFCKACGTKLD